MLLLPAYTVVETEKPKAKTTQVRTKVATDKIIKEIKAKDESVTIITRYNNGSFRGISYNWEDGGFATMGGLFKQSKSPPQRVQRFLKPIGISWATQ